MHMTDVDEVIKMLMPFQKPLRLHESDLKYIVQRFSYLKQKLGANGLKGYPDTKLLLTSVYCYIRDPANGRKIISLNKFVKLCSTFHFTFRSKDFWRYEQFYFEYDYYPRAPISNPLMYFEAAWYDISKDLSIDDELKGQLISLLKKVNSLKAPKRSPWIVTAAAIHLLDNKRGHYRTQFDLGEYFGISEVSIRCAAHDLESCMNGL